MDLKGLIDGAAAGSCVTLPSGEFEGPLVISKPLRLVGKNTTIWSKSSPVIEINSNGVSIENIRAELTEGGLNDIAVSAGVLASAKDIEVLGGVRGFGAEDGFFDVPRTIGLGEFAADSVNTFTLAVNVPDKTEIVCNIREVAFSPSTLNAGRSELTVTVSGISAQTYLYAEVLFKSKFTRRIYLTGRPAANAERAENKRIYDAPERDFSRAPLPEPISAPAATDVISMTRTPDKSLPALAMRRGQRVSLSQYIGSRFDIFFTCEKPRGYEIDPYVFLLGEDERSLGDAGLIFFGNERSENGEVVYVPADGHIEVDLAKVDFRVRRIALAYSIYAGDTVKNFASVRTPRVSIRAGGERVSFVMDGLSAEATVVALEFYLYKGEWKISAVGAGYKDGMAKLCNRYGIEVVDE
ncbi:MAG: TerD family protein [Lachnospiraceae bacterium]|nr:TerD family protein [Ruminococcus sp.]MCM1273937.1 TerD family protein [Lachnospiraceae bacterium]